MTILPQPYEVLIVLNGLEAVDFASLEFAVITEPAKQAWSVERQEFVDRESWWPFERGEVLVLDRRSGREPFGEQRKPGRWSVRCEHFATFAEAMARHHEVVAIEATP